MMGPLFAATVALLISIDSAQAAAKCQDADPAFCHARYYRGLGYADDGMPATGGTEIAAPSAHNANGAHSPRRVAIQIPDVMIACVDNTEVKSKCAGTCAAAVECKDMYDDMGPPEGLGKTPILYTGRPAGKPRVAFPEDEHRKASDGAKQLHGYAHDPKNGKAQVTEDDCGDEDLDFCRTRYWRGLGYASSAGCGMDGNNDDGHNEGTESPRRCAIHMPPLWKACQASGDNVERTEVRTKCGAFCGGNKAFEGRAACKKHYEAVGPPETLTAPTTDVTGEINGHVVADGSRPEMRLLGRRMRQTTTRQLSQKLAELTKKTRELLHE
jgi:hypothetical protein